MTRCLFRLRSSEILCAASTFTHGVDIDAAWRSTSRAAALTVFPPTLCCAVRCAEQLGFTGHCNGAQVRVDARAAYVGQGVCHDGTGRFDVLPDRPLHRVSCCATAMSLKL